tara:strand:+ start:1489 stop:3000 length:1512 start_codon:yes stop_codon:yes gene_type:complete
MTEKLPVDESADTPDSLLLSNVRPPGHENPPPRERYDLVVIGAGAGGLVSSAIAAGLGARVALVEEHRLGGDCLNTGCVPSKGLIAAARSWQAARDSSALFGGPEVRGAGDFQAAMDRMRRLRASISPADSVERFIGMGVDVFLGRAKFAGPSRVEVDGATLNFRRAVIATGSRPVLPPIEGLADSGCLDNTTLFDLESAPARLVVIGAGPIGCEMAQCFRRFGSEVTLLESAAEVLPREDPEAAALVRESLEEEGVCCLLGVEILRVEAGVRVHYRQGETMEVAEGDELLVAAGRAPNVEGLELGSAGVKADGSGVIVDGQLRTDNPVIYAVGDVCSEEKFTHAADAQARIAVQNALFFRRLEVRGLVVPRCTYTSPELAHVGYDPEGARAAGFQIDTITIPMAESDRAVLDGEQTGFLRLHLLRGSDRILGATVVSSHAGELISELSLAITHKLGLRKMGGIIRPYPTRSEVLSRACGQWQRGRLSPAIRKIIEAFLGIFR